MPPSSPLTSGARFDPVAGPMPAPGPARSLWKLRHRLRALLGIRRSFRVDGFYYKETSPELLWRALSRKGSGSKEFRVTFPDRSKMLIHCAPDRVYADAVGPLLLPVYQRAATMIRPGMRALDLSCGTGYGAAWLARQVGPSGAVVAVNPDQESIAYAQKRYAPFAPQNVAFEIGDVNALHGETDGGFDAVFSLGCLHLLADDQGFLAELWRVVAPGGWMLIGVPGSGPAVPTNTPTTTGATGPARRYDAAGLIEVLSRPEVLGWFAGAARPELLTTPAEDFHLALLRKPVS